MIRGREGGEVIPERRRHRTVVSDEHADVGLPTWLDNACDEHVAGERSPILATVSSASLELLPALRRAHDLIDREFASPIDLDAMAGAAGYSRFHFARAFRSAYGESPRAYLTRRRIERAKALLRSANLTVTEICLAVGFESLGSFGSRFRQLVGETPSAYRARSVEAAGPPPVPGCVALMWTRPHPAPVRGESTIARVGSQR
jgi:AraC-like DNA-binding protein